MATKQEELSDPNGCLGKAAPDEPIFVLRAHDMLAPWMVRQWARHFLMLNSTLVNIGTERKPELRMQPSTPEVKAKHDEAMVLAARMEAWHNRKIPD